MKRLAGELFEVGANVYTEGHDLLAACVALRGPGDRSWSRVPMAYDYDADHWSAALHCDRIGRWEFRVEAWTDHWASWCSDLRKRVQAGQDVAIELLDGARILGRAARAQRAEPRARLRAAERALEDAQRPVAERVAIALDQVDASEAGAAPARGEVSCSPPYPLTVDRRAAGFGAWYELFPRSQAREPGQHGTFRDVEARLPELAELGFDVLYLPPVHPIGRTHRKGPNNQERGAPGDLGSPWAIGAEEGGHTALHPQLGSFEDFDRMVSQANALGIEIALDFALQCSPDHPWVREHPGWFKVRADGSIRYAENPPKRYQDIYPLDFWCEDREALWFACREALRFWIDRGVRIFRVDNPHTKPFSFWEWLISDIQRDRPDVLFLAEAFTRPVRMRGLAKLGFTQSYTYFTWKNSAWELREYLTELTRTEMVEYYRPNFFANTPDILHEYLQRGGRPAFRIRLLLAATLSPIYGIYSGFELCENTPVREGSEEYLDSEKYQIRTRDWAAPGNILDDIRKLNRLRRAHPALQQLAQLDFVPSDNPNLIAYHKGSGGDRLLAAVVLDPHRAHEATLRVSPGDLGLAPDAPIELEDLLTGVHYTWRGDAHYVRIDPAEQPGHLLRVLNVPRAEDGAPERP